MEYMASWYEDDAFDYEDGKCINFQPDVMHSSYHDSLGEAKIAAFKGASRNDCVGWAGVWVINPPLSNDEDCLFVNEIYKNKWSGWQKRT